MSEIMSQALDQANAVIKVLQAEMAELRAQLVCESAEFLEDGEAPPDYVRGWNDALSTVSGKPVPMPDEFLKAQQAPIAPQAVDVDVEPLEWGYPFKEEGERILRFIQVYVEGVVTRRENDCSNPGENGRDVTEAIYKALRSVATPIAPQAVAVAGTKPLADMIAKYESDPTKMEALETARIANTPAVPDAKATKQPLPWVAKSMESQQRDYGRITTSTGSYVADFMDLEDAQLVVERMNSLAVNTPAVRGIIESAWRAGYWQAGYTNDSSYADEESRKYATEILAIPTANDKQGGE
jgi:hypothetical protein